ncbi:hypothetical protein [Exiguobacterium sp. s196]|uniref:hypothetical protein n=1 Tax=Exiguobacterium sp. s196 TaxID=2751283 RepID=UPI001BE94DFA|nr:hypothetical protein [Exiguobacterium sp. s196]
MIIVKYKTEQEAQQIIDEKQAQGLTLVEVSNITEGNFLGFVENPKNPTSLEEKVTQLEQLVQEQNLTQMEVLATIYEQLLGGA